MLERCLIRFLEPVSFGFLRVDDGHFLEFGGQFFFGEFFVEGTACCGAVAAYGWSTHLEGLLRYLLRGLWVCGLGG